MIKRMVRERTLMLMERDTSDNGLTINSMELESNLGLMEQCMKVNISKEKNITKASLHSQMDQFMKEIFK
jgi:hypothetical protein